MIGKIINK